MCKQAASVVCLGLILFWARGIAFAQGKQAKGKPGIAATPCTVTIKAEKQQQMSYGMDFERLWSWDSLEAAEKAKLARLAVKECRVDYARVAIHGAAEIKEGQIKWEAYDQIIDCMNHLKQARPDIQFFASPRPFHEAVKGSPNLSASSRTASSLLSTCRSSQ